jgi:LysR family glycine cleavage system transcriptional activator
MQGSENSMVRRRDLPNLNDVVAFEAAARTGGFTQAASGLNVGQPAISRRISLLEDWLGIKLFHRRGPILTLTDAGREILPTVEHSLVAMETGFAVLKRRSTPTPVLSVSVSIAFAGCYLIDRLPGFQARHPDIEVQLLTRYANQTPGADDADVTIYFNEDPDYDGPDRCLFPEDLIVVCAQGYQYKRGRVRSLQDLLKQDLLVLDEPAHRGDWAALLAPSGLTPPTPRPAHCLGNFVVYLNAILAERGIGLAWRELVRAPLRERRLVQPVETSHRSRRGYYLRHAPRPDAKAFSDWLTSPEAADTPIADDRPG